jgi:hypothetical protein
LILIKMTMKLHKLFIISTIAIILSSCGTVKEGFTNQKKNSSDEFLVEKKLPLVMPPDYNELPIPKEENIDKKKNESEIKSLILKNENKITEDIEIEKDMTLEDFILKKLKKIN